MDGMNYILLALAPGLIYFLWYFLFTKPRLRRKQKLELLSPSYYVDVRTPIRDNKGGGIPFDFGPTQPPTFVQALEAVNDYIRAFENLQKSSSESVKNISVELETRVRDEQNSLLLVIKDKLDIMEKWYLLSQRENTQASETLEKAVSMLININTNRLIKEYRTKDQLTAVSSQIQQDQAALRGVSSLTRKLSVN